MNHTLLFILLIIGVVTLFVAGPLISILALNTLFPLAIPYTLGSWAAMIWVNLTILGGGSHIAQAWKK